MKFLSRIALLLACLAVGGSLTARDTRPTGTTPAPPKFRFSPAATTGLAPYDVELADMDGDGDLDAVTANLVDETGAT